VIPVEAAMTGEVRPKIAQARNGREFRDGAEGGAEAVRRRYRDLILSGLGSRHARIGCIQSVAFDLFGYAVRVTANLAAIQPVRAQFADRR
jgi:hypothetical protein